MLIRTVEHWNFDVVLKNSSFDVVYKGSVYYI